MEMLWDSITRILIVLAVQARQTMRQWEHGRFHSHNREQIEVAPQLEWWWQWIRSQAEMVQSVYVFINDDFSGYAPASVNKLKGIIGLPTVEPDLPKQMKLF